MAIQISNPIDGGATHVTRKRAEKHVRSGIAEWSGTNSIRFIESHHRVRSAQSSQGYYTAGRLRIATAREMKAIPVVNGRELLAPSAKRVGLRW